VKRGEARTNIRFGLLMFVVALLMFGTSIAWAVLYAGFVK
jgi:hypothetical protein